MIIYGEKNTRGHVKEWMQRGLISLIVTYGMLFVQLSLVTGQTTGPDVPQFQVRPGYQVTLAAGDIPNARFLETDSDGTIFVSRPRQGDILALRDEDNDGVYEFRRPFIEGYDTVHGMDYHKGWLWFTQTGAVHKARDADGDGEADKISTVIPQDRLYSQGGGHWWRSILVTGEALYTSIGDPGNINPDRDTPRKKIWRFNPDGSGKELFSSGIRNTEKLRERPGTSEIWGADHNSDWFGKPLGENRRQQPITDMNPPGEFNHYVEGGFYGHPFLVGPKIPRIEYQERKDIIDLAEKTIPPEWNFGPHWAPNGFTFISPQNTHFPEDHRGDAMIAFHGSWNSSVRVGYAIQRILFDEHTGDPYGSLRIVTTLHEKNRRVLARPVDCVETGDGNILFSDDQGGNIYRITYSGGESGN